MLDSSVADTGTGLSKLTSKSSINDLLFSTNELQKTCYELNKLLVNLNSLGLNKIDLNLLNTIKIGLLIGYLVNK